MTWEMVVGLEVHVELATATKLFSASPNRFGDEPNTNIDPVTLGLPGSLPVTALVNELFHAVQYAGRGEWDHSAIVTLIEDMAGVTARSALR